MIFSWLYTQPDPRLPSPFRKQTHLGSKAKHLDLQLYTLFQSYMSTLSFNIWISIKKASLWREPLFIYECLNLFYSVSPLKENISSSHKYCRPQKCSSIPFLCRPHEVTELDVWKLISPSMAMQTTCGALWRLEQMSFKRIPKRIFTGLESQNILFLSDREACGAYRKNGLRRFKVLKSEWK